MKTVKLKRQGADPSGGDPTQRCSVWTEGSKLHWLRAKIFEGRNENEEGDRDCGSEAAAEDAAQVLIDELIAEGFAVRGKRTPRPPAVASKARKPGMRPAWLDDPPKALSTSLSKLKRAAKAKKLEHRFPEIEVLLRPGADLRIKKAKPADLERVTSRIGGPPLLAQGTAWPVHDGKPLTFVAQIALDEVTKSVDLDDRLPDGGMLSFFAQLDPDSDQYGEVGRMLHSATDGLQLARPPSESCVLAKAGVLTPKMRLMAPPADGPLVQALELSPDEHGDYHDEIHLGQVPEGRNHILLGWPSAVTQHELARKLFVAQFNSDRRVDLDMGSFSTLRFYIEGERVTAKSLKTAVCTLSEG